MTNKLLFIFLKSPPTEVLIPALYKLVADVPLSPPGENKVHCIGHMYASLIFY